MEAPESSMKARKRRIRPRSGHSIKTARDDSDPIDRLIEGQEQSYDPPHYTGGSISPLFYPFRPKRYGYYMIVVATLILAVVVLAIKAGAMDWYELTILWALMVFIYMVGFKLIQKQPPQDEALRSSRRSGKLDD